MHVIVVSRVLHIGIYAEAVACNNTLQVFVSSFDSSTNYRKNLRIFRINLSFLSGVLVVGVKIVHAQALP